MTAMDAIREADRLRPNSYPTEEKLRWLARLEARIREEILLHYEPETTAAQEAAPEPPDRRLCVETPYDEMYVHWLCAQMALFEQELESFNAANALFEAVFARFRNAYNREHRPKVREKRYC